MAENSQRHLNNVFTAAQVAMVFLPPDEQARVARAILELVGVYPAGVTSLGNVVEGKTNEAK